jgi:hypothetical protein
MSRKETKRQDAPAGVLPFMLLFLDLFDCQESRDSDQVAQAADVPPQA